MCSGGDDHEVTVQENGEDKRGVVGGHNSAGRHRQQFGMKQGQGNRKWIQKRRESLKGFPFSSNLVFERAPPLL